MSVIRELTAVLGIQVDESSLAKADAALEKATTVVLGVGAAWAGAGAALFALVKRTSDAAIQVDRLAASVGLTTDSFQLLTYAAKSVGVDANGLAGALVSLADKAVAAKGGSTELQGAFRKLGVSVVDSKGKLKDVDVLLAELAEGFAKLPDNVTRASLAQKLLGGQGAKLLPLLTQGRDGLKAQADEAAKLGIILNSQAIQASKDFDAALGRLMGTLDGLALSLGTNFMRAATHLVERLQEIAEELVPIIKSKASEWARGLGVAFDFVARAGEHLDWVLGALAVVMVTKLLLATSALTAAQVAQGQAAVVASLRAAAASATATVAAWAAILPWALLAAAIVLAADELYVFSQGGDSLFGRFIKWVDTIDPEDNALINFFKRGMSVLFDLTDTRKWKLYLESILRLFTSYVDLIVELIGSIFAPLKNMKIGFGGGPIAELRSTAVTEAERRRRFADVAAGPTLENRVTDAADAVVGWGRMVARDTKVTGFSVGRGSEDLTPFFGAGGRADTAMSSVARSRTAASYMEVNAPVTLNQTVQAAPGQSPVDVANASMDRAQEALEAQQRATYEAVKQ
ncbi:phage tail tape measure protein [Corallococcus sp. EGB]|uniref:phage tail tape measure protein n=1 Tax=Corallococcus sp. EGB TaxID=1521117 RepID=UPI001CBC2A68|nr:phage tail tape measure protein [Corallococcus sp. EGB]